MFQFDRDGRFIDVRGEKEELFLPPEKFLERKIENVIRQERAALKQRRKDFHKDGFFKRMARNIFGKRGER